MLDYSDYEWAAKELGCEVNAIRAVAKVESHDGGFLEDGRPKILFEAHHFSKLTGGKYDKSYPNISSANWNKRLYIGGAAEHGRFEIAARLDREAAIKSCSWGMFQIMGFNWKACNYICLQDFVNDMYAGEFGQLKAFVRLIKAMRLQDALQDRNWKGFARNYNGPGYQQNEYDLKIKTAFETMEGIA